MLKLKQQAFTIVELLIVIVVIAILAAISIVAYNGIQNRARTSSVTSALSQAVKKIKVWQVDNPSTTPSSLATVGVTSDDVTYQYSPGTNGSYCITATNGNISYKITENSAATSGGCAGHGQGGQSAITNILPNPSAETNQTYIANASGSTVTREINSSATNGSYAVKVVTNGVNSYEGAAQTISHSSFGIFTASAYGWGSGNVRIWMRLIYSDATSTDSPSVLYSLSASPQRMSASHTFANNGKTPTTIQIFIRTDSIQAVTFYLDSFMLNSGGLVGYADGSSTNWVWNGTAHASTSTGPAL